MSSNEFWEMVQQGYNLVATHNGRVVEFQHDTHRARISCSKPTWVTRSNSVITISITEVDKPQGEPMIAPPSSSRRDD